MINAYYENNKEGKERHKKDFELRIQNAQFLTELKNINISDARKLLHSYNEVIVDKENELRNLHFKKGILEEYVELYGGDQIK